MIREKSSFRANYHDIKLFLVLIPLINALNYYLTYTNIAFSWHTALTYSVDTLQGYTAWFTIRSIILILDQKMPYANDPLKRIIVQLVLTSLAGLAVIIFSTEFLNWILKGTPMPASFYRFDIFIFLIWFFVINGIYIGIFYYQQMRFAEQQRIEEKKVRAEGFLTRSGKQQIIIPFAEAAGVYVEGDYAVLVTTSGRKHLLDQSLDRVEENLPEEMFFRINRQYILNRNMIRGFERAENSKINVLVNTSDHLPGSMQMSRTRAPAFKSWFRSQN
ncbi:MAG: LytTR family transcriptional regulator DNA-binding domain-containing protein [Chitinophagales bacterium]